MAQEFLIAAEESSFFLGDDLLPWLLLAFGAAMVVGNVAALLRPPAAAPGELNEHRDPPPLGRAMALIALGAVAAIWAAASLLSR